jgi:hypothetical protein
MKKLQYAGILVASVAWGLTGCAQVSEVSGLLFSTTVPAIALVNGQLLQGEVLLLNDRSGRATLKSSAKPPTTGSSAEKNFVSSCIGQLRYTSTVAGVLDLRCDGGVQTELRFTMLSETRGYAYGQTPHVAVSLTYGLTSDEAKAYLKLPANKQLVGRLDGPELELR